MALIAQLVEHCTGNAKVVGSNPVKSLNVFQVIFPVVSWLHSRLSFFHVIATVGHLLPEQYIYGNYVKKLWPQADPESSEPTPIQTLTQKMVRTLFKSIFPFLINLYYV